MAEFTVSSGGAQANFTAAISQAQIAGTTAATDIVTGASADDLTTTVSSQSSIDWVDEKDPPIKVGYDAVHQRLSFSVDRTVLGSGTDSDFNTFSIYGGASQTAG